MATTVTRVSRHLGRDPALAEALLRDLVNLRRTARWLIEENGWDVTEEAVVSALRRYRDDGGRAPARRPGHTPTRARVEVRTGLAIVHVQPGPGTARRLLEVHGRTGIPEPVGLLPAGGRTWLLVGAEWLQEVEQALDPDQIETVRGPLGMVRMICEDEDATTQALMVGLAALEHAQIRVDEVFTVGRDCLLLVDERRTREAYDVICTVASPREGD